MSSETFTAVMLIFTTTFLSKWNIFLQNIKDIKKLIALFFSGLLIFINWSIWIYAVASERIIDASFGYFIMPILSVLFGYIFFKEILNKLRVFSIILTFFSVVYLFYFYKNFPWIGLTVGLSWSLYNVFRKKIDVEVDLGLLIESLLILPFALIAFYLVYDSGNLDFGR